MERTPEPELMNDPAQARAYAAADFSEPHSRFVGLFAERCGAVPPGGRVLDLGCGPADISIRFARAHPRVEVHGLDGAAAMLREGERLLTEAGLAHRVRLVHGVLPDCRPPAPPYDALISNSLLHHLPEPQTLWEALHRWGRPGAAVFVMDLLRPASRQEAQRLVERYAADEPEILRRDFFHSLLAAWRPAEVREQLRQAGLAHLSVEQVSDRHFIVYGALAAGER